MASPAPFEDVTAADRLRFALCYQNLPKAQIVSAVDWDAAGAMYDANVKPESFKTVTQRALKAAADTTPPAADNSRFAICFINSSAHNLVDWNKAGLAFNSKTKPASFRTVVGRALTKYGYAVKGPTKANAAKKRAPAKGNDDKETTAEKRAHSDGEDDDGEEEVAEEPAPKKPRKNLKTLQPKASSKKDEPQDPEDDLKVTVTFDADGNIDSVE